ncbi:MAG: hypothetical protein WCU80_10700 [Paludibacteraceae bacterium]
MKKIESISTISFNNPKEFYEKLRHDIDVMQNSGQTVEVQYTTDVINNPEYPIVHSAMILGRK